VAGLPEVTFRALDVQEDFAFIQEGLVAIYAEEGHVEDFLDEEDRKIEVEGNLLSFV
jgi:hypothetical protein